MAFQIECGEVENKEIGYIDEMKKVRLTDNLQEICNNFFDEKTFLEGAEEVKLNVAFLSDIEEIEKRLEEKIPIAIEELSKARGEEKKTELVEKLKDYFYLQSIIVDMMIKVKNHNNAVLVLV